MAHTFNCLFREDEWQALTELAHNSRCSRSEIIRRAVLANYNMTFNGVATCSNGDRCLAPQLHAGNLTPQNPRPTSPSQCTVRFKA
jgi:hypothetical protein